LLGEGGLFVGAPAVHAFLIQQVVGEQQARDTDEQVLDERGEQAPNSGQMPTDAAEKPSACLLQ
jgi:hypothetical protein